MSFDKRSNNLSKTIIYPASQVEAQWSRTNQLSYKNYFGDGAGRDSYIVNSNGGMARLAKTSMQHRNKSVHHDTIPVPRKDPPSHTYISDGKGRDSYVLRGNGGLVNDYKGSALRSFYGTLRQHDFIPEPKKRNYHLRGSMDSVYFERLRPTKTFHKGNGSNKEAYNELKTAITQTSGHI